MFHLAVTQFVQSCAKRLGWEPKGIEIIPYRNPEDITEGRGGVSVFFVKDKKGNLLCVIKCFSVKDEADLANFTSLVASKDISTNIPLKKCILTFPFAFSHAKQETWECAIVGIHAAKGKSVNAFMKEIETLPPDSPEREKAKKHLASIFSVMGHALGELHGISPSSGPIADCYWKRAEEYYNLIRDNFEKSDLPFDKETFETHYQDLYQEMLRHPSPCGFLHGDAHPGNFFFDEESQRLTMIDMDAITLSVSHRGTPAGPSVFDYIFASESCRIYGTLHGLSDQEIRELTIAFEESYLDEIGDLFPSEQSIRYYRFLFWLNKINLTNTADPDLSKKIWEQSQKIREMAITYLCEDMEKL